MKAALLVLLALCGAAHAEMALNPDVRQDNIAQTICVPGYTATIRPPVSFTNAIKFRLMDEAGIPRSRAHELELDHIVPLAAGGAPRSTDNLRLQTWAATSEWPGIDADAHRKDALEVALRNAICRGEIPLAEAQRCIYDDWQACAKQHPSLTPKGPSQ